MIGRTLDPESDRRGRIDLARRALQLAGDDADTLANSALALGYFGEDIGAMSAVADRALSLNPSFARGWHVRGLLSLWAGQLDQAVHDVETSLRLSPRVRAGWALTVIGGAHFFARRFDEAAPKLLLAVQEEPDFLPSLRWLAACYAQMGRLSEAREIACLIPSGGLIPSVIPYRDPEHRELLLSGLRLAAGEAL